MQARLPTVRFAARQTRCPDVDHPETSGRRELLKVVCPMEGIGAALNVAEDRYMLRIVKDFDGSVITLHLCGRIQSDQIASIRSEMNDDGTSKMLDLSEVTLVDIGVIQFLISCEEEGVELVHCPPYVREWMLRERAEGGQRRFSNAT